MAEEMTSCGDDHDDHRMPSSIRAASSTITLANRRDHFLARIGWKRGGHRVAPGLYALGKATSESPVFVSANYTLSFDALRSALDGISGYILVLDTKGINVWCAAGKGTFGTDELVRSIKATRLDTVVRHRALILPQLGASGVSAHQVEQQSGFQVEYGPVRAIDLPEYLKTHRATVQMRQVRFTLGDRLILIPVELTSLLLPILVIVAVRLFLLGGTWAFSAIAALLAGSMVFPILLPYLPTHDFSTKGFILGGLVALPLALLKVFSLNPGLAAWHQIGFAFTDMLIWPAVTAFVALNFTGSTTFTSRSGVRREIFKYVPAMALFFGSGIILRVLFRII